jgi:hypothetical protein
VSYVTFACFKLRCDNIQKYESMSGVVHRASPCLKLTTTRTHDTSLRATLGYTAKPFHHVFKVHQFSGTQIRHVVRHFALKCDQTKTQEEWNSMIGPSPSVRNLLKKLFGCRSEHSIQRQLEQLFDVSVEISLCNKR